MADIILDVPPKTSLSRRNFLRAAGVGAAALFLGDKTINFLAQIPNREVDQRVIQREKLDNLGLGELGKTRCEYFAMWPYSRIWVVVNNLLASEKLNGLELKKNQEYSLIKLLDLEKSYKNNFNPSKGYLTGTPLFNYSPFISFSEAHGVSLTATCLARSATTAPVAITEWSTHADAKDPVMKDYFDSKYQYLSTPLFSRLGSDATVYYEKGFSADFKFIPKTDLKLRYKIMDINGKEIVVPNFLDALKKYPQSVFTRFTDPILLRVAFGSSEPTNHKITLTPTVIDDYGGRKRPGFTRELTMDGVTTKEKFQALYDTNGAYYP